MVNESRVTFLILFCVSVALFAVGMGEFTSVTSKDEYHRVFRTALQMIEQNTWWIPTLDGEPRLEKPPLLAWLTRVSFELFGIAVTSARMIIVAFSALFVGVIALIGQELRQDGRYAVTAGMVALSGLECLEPRKFLSSPRLIPLFGFLRNSFHAKTLTSSRNGG